MKIADISLHPSDSSRLERLAVWIHLHPTTTKVLKISGLIIGAGILASLPFTAPILGAGLVVPLAITGVFLVLISSLALLALDLIAPPHHDMKNHAFKPGECPGGRLYYEGDVPILTLNTDDPFVAGKAHGYLCGEAINQVTRRFSIMFGYLINQPPAERRQTLDALYRAIPAAYIREMMGVLEGYNQWAKEQHWWQFPKKLTMDDVLLIHMLPDKNHFRPAQAVNVGAEREQAVACTAMLDRDPQNGIVFARNMDWASLGVLGKYSLVINHRNQNGRENIVSVGPPGFVGIITGMNSDHVSLAMNVCAGSTNMVRGMPACFFNRACLENCRSVNEIDAYIQNNHPLGPYHMTIADRERGESIHFYQSPFGTHVTRTLPMDQPLVTLNTVYRPEPEREDNFESRERQEIIDEFIQNRDNRPLVDALALPKVNNWGTLHRVVMEPRTGTFKVGFDNAFAGRTPLQAVSTQRLLGP